MAPEVKEVNDDDKEKQVDIATRYPELDSKEKGVLSGLDIAFDKQKGMTPEDINKGMNARFDKEVAKAGNSGNTPFIEERKAELCKNIEKTTDMKEKIALYQEFLDGLKGDVGTRIAEQNERFKRNSLEMEKSEKGDIRRQLREKESTKPIEGSSATKSLKNSLDSLGAQIGALTLGNMVREAMIQNEQAQATKRIAQSEAREQEPVLKLSQELSGRGWPL